MLAWSQALPTGPSVGYRVTLLSTVHPTVRGNEPYQLAGTLADIISLGKTNDGLDRHASMLRRNFNYRLQNSSQTLVFITFLEKCKTRCEAFPCVEARRHHRVQLEAAFGPVTTRARWG